MWNSLSITTVLLAVYQQQDFVCATHISSKAVKLTIAHSNKEIIHNNVFVDPLRRHLAVVLAVVQHATQQTTEAVRGSHSTDAVTEHKLKEIVETNVKIMKGRLRRQTSTKYQPYTSDPYDIGPLDRCVRPSSGRCTFSSNITVPEYYARQLRSLDTDYDHLDDQLKKIGVKSECRNSLVTSVCESLLTMKCVGNGMVDLQPPTQTACKASIAKLSGCSASYRQALQTNLCSDYIYQNLSHHGVSGRYSLTECRTPAISACQVSAQSPEWIAVQYENDFNERGDNHFVTSYRLTGSCKTNYLRLACTLPTCTSDNRLQGTLSYSQCQVATKCIVDAVNVPEYVSTDSLLEHCDEYKHIASPSADLGIGSNLPILLLASALSMLQLVY